MLAQRRLHCLNTVECSTGLQDQNYSGQKQNISPFRSVDGILNKCSGTCGNVMAKFIECCCSTTQDPSIFNDYQSFIETQFRFCDSTIRHQLILIIKPIRLNYPYYIKLKSSEYQPKGMIEVRKIVSLFQKLSADGYDHILQDLANHTCCIPPKPLFAEIIDNINALRFHKCDELQKELDHLNATNLILSKYSNDVIKSEDICGTIIVLNQQKIELIKLLEKENIKLANVVPFNIEYYNQRLCAIKRHKNYQIMEQKNQKLSDMEVYALLLYCDADLYCYEMRKSHRNKVGTCYWKTLFSHLCSAIEKMHTVFHFNRKQNKWKNYNLFHGCSASKLSEKQQHSLTLNTITSFSHHWSVARDFALPNGIVLVIEDARTSLSIGRLKGADVSWISRHSEGEIIVLPTVFNDFRTVTINERIKNGWIIGNTHKMYATLHYVSKQKPQRYVWHHYLIILLVAAIAVLWVGNNCSKSDISHPMEYVCDNLSYYYYLLHTLFVNVVLGSMFWFLNILTNAFFLYVLTYVIWKCLCSKKNIGNLCKLFFYCCCIGYILVLVWIVYFLNSEEFSHLSTLCWKCHPDYIYKCPNCKV